ncbi:Deacetylvindoline O-acetyltransferase [Morus notabilis]|uniref:Deacetylvindoline O-acetyltransferase n=2 Tax=Morus notabilis TaxID=981085 RepID=W9RKE9_9ROSA|nr:Deacetylvindoline O-acetyltransferase [Morus notabilis]
MDMIEIIKRETIKPSSPTPQHNRIHNLCWFDQISTPFFIPILLFYRHGLFNTSINAVSETSSLLINSLSKTLSKYYPFAGRIRDRESILCNDEGVDFLVAKVKQDLSSLLHNPKAEILHLLFPDNLQWRNTDVSFLLAVQVNYFDCGGLAIGVCMSHKLSDAATLVSFINCWASTARNAGRDVSFPVLNVASLFPRGDLPLFPEAVHWKGNYASRRFVFEAEKINSLKAVISEKVENPTRVEAVTALLYKSAIKASRAVVSNAKTSSHLLVQQVNMRTRMVPELPETSVGSLSWFFPVLWGSIEMDDQSFFVGLVSRMREAFTKLCSSFADKFGGEDWFLEMLEILKEYKGLLSRSDQVVYRFSSWCRFPVYEADFGWGKPVWVTSVGTVDKNVIILMDHGKNGGGIEAFVTLEEDEMFVFECDQELLAFASCNPSVLY